MPLRAVWLGGGRCRYGCVGYGLGAVFGGAERERRAKVIHAEGEQQAAQKLLEAAIILAKQPQAIQLRYLQTLTEIAGEKSSAIVFPLPIDLLSSLESLLRKQAIQEK